MRPLERAGTVFGSVAREEVGGAEPMMEMGVTRRRLGGGQKEAAGLGDLGGNGLFPTDAS